jgi:hypothetical protein
MKNAFKKVMSIGAAAALMLCLVLCSTLFAYAAYADGTYSVPVTCKGGSGRGGVRSASVKVSKGVISSVELVMSSANYDYAYDPVTGTKIDAGGEDVSVFTIAYPGDNFSFTVDTTAMSEPHEITYELTLDLSSLPQAAEPESPKPSDKPEPSGSGEGSEADEAAKEAAKEAEEKAAKEAAEKAAKEAEEKAVKEAEEKLLKETAEAAAKEAEQKAKKKKIAYIAAGVVIVAAIAIFAVGKKKG